MKKANFIILANECYWYPALSKVEYFGTVIKLSKTQNRLIEILHKSVNVPIDGEDIFYHIFDQSDKFYNSRSVRNIVSGLRKKLPCVTIENIYGGKYLFKKYPDYYEDYKNYLLDILDQSTNGIIITDPNRFDNPIIYVNRSFEEIFGYKFEEVVHKNCRFLQNGDRDQSVLKEIRDAIKNEKAVSAKLRNYHKSGKLINNELTISPIFDKETKKIKFFIGIQQAIFH